MKPQPLAGVSVVLVEDNTDGRELLEAFLRFVGANVRSAANAEEGFHLFKQSPQRWLSRTLCYLDTTACGYSNRSVHRCQAPVLSR